MSSPDTEIYDLRGLKCPYPAIKTEKRLRAMASGTTLTVETTDPLAVIDIPHLCNEKGHTLLTSEKTESGHRFVIRKG
ncbi:sulfurtransferase TusA family protein [Rhizobium sp. WW22]|uniref:tRNA 2-thiouridine synthesizing protein A n=1 Tax=Rhizobium miluonense TaxID=411945 RepID=A0ABU1SQ08_9HYPH|nr:sulfurtransferase TusA family protein [Rhizobium miluonense]MBB3385794.1 tRNA 2-thiouridine synthesizing protein A [Rhizobium sp. BK098]MBB3617499.1 tRNA 2-thiouridine synthesizing protein A [Rhizobium sp. BK609]MBB3683238.1 tRNA 2-thiouridine synthesizing protein A [Rhizobium sp. BK612]MDR6901052.1 tRNA 2-thiouridine synthesizing protein A [Rhizobium miluonense]